MEMINLSLPATNRFATDYLAGVPEIQRFFHYRYQHSADYQARLIELNKRTFMRKELAECIEKYMECFPSSTEVKMSLEKLKKENSAVIIGGQQAGILTGPLYSIHKVISIIALARQKEKELNIPVVPIFWIAGEDHDFQEVNHIYLEKNGEIQKVIYPEKVRDKRMVSDVGLDKEICMEWVEEIIETFGETDHTNELLSFMREAVQESETFVDFFAQIVMGLFKDEGLLVIDSGYQGLRCLEKELFISQIEQVTEINRCVKDVQNQLADKGFNRSIEMSDQAANLFYYDDEYKERILLEYNEVKQQFIGKNGALRFSRTELLDIASEFPWKLSNNVVTRPITQEMLFPTLAFIAGPGEIAYWAELKQVFEHFSIKMPLIVPRLNITLLDRAIESDFEELGLSLEEVLTNGTGKQQDVYLESVKDLELEKLFQYTKKQLLENYGMIQQKLDKGLIPLFEKNQARLLEQIEFMEGKSEDHLKQKHEVALSKFYRVDHSLRPIGAPQERILNALNYMNHYGIPFLSELAHLNYEFDGKHKVIKI